MYWRKQRQYIRFMYTKSFFMNMKANVRLSWQNIQNTNPKENSIHAQRDLCPCKVIILYPANAPLICNYVFPGLHKLIQIITFERIKRCYQERHLRTENATYCSKYVSSTFNWVYIQFVYMIYGQTHTASDIKISTWNKTVQIQKNRS